MTSTISDETRSGGGRLRQRHQRRSRKTHLAPAQAICGRNFKYLGTQGVSTREMLRAARRLERSRPSRARCREINKAVNRKCKRRVAEPCRPRFRASLFGKRGGTSAHRSESALIASCIFFPRRVRPPQVVGQRKLVVIGYAACNSRHFSIVSVSLNAHLGNRCTSVWPWRFVYAIWLCAGWWQCGWNNTFKMLQNATTKPTEKVICKRQACIN